MGEQAFYNGMLYQIEYRPQLSNSDYTQHKVYYIKTKEENYDKAKKAIVSIMEDELGYEQGYLWTSGEYHIKNRRGHLWQMLSIHTMSSTMMRTWMYLYLLLSYLMMIEYDYRQTESCCSLL